MEKNNLENQNDELLQKYTDSEARFRNIIMHTIDAIIVTNMEGVVRFVNPMAVNLLNKAPNEIIGQMFGFPAVVNELAEIEIIVKGEDSRTGIMRVTQTEWDGETALLISIRDITDQKKSEIEREQLRAQAMQSQKLESIGTLAGGVAHEINNPINGILNYAQLIKDKAEAESKQYEYASEIIAETERVAAIVRDLLAFARQDKQAHSPARMTDIVKGTTTLIQTIIRGDMIELEVDVPDDLPELKCRSQQIQQVIMNLLTNARDALNERYKGYDEKKIIRIYARTIEKAGRRWIRTTVEDYGTGIPEEVRERIFDPFFTTKGRTEGTGLGLSISHGIIEDHHGKLTAESVVNEYTRFQLDLPVDNEWELDGQNS